MSEFGRKKEIIKQLIQAPINKRHGNKFQVIRRKYAEYINKYKVLDSVVFYEAYSGRGVLGSPYAIFSEFMNRPDFGQYTHVWSIDGLEANKSTIDKFKEYSNVIFVERHSDEYLKYLATAKYLINNSTFHYYFMKREEQVFINTWHGIPIKTLGFDIPNGAYESANVLKNFLACDYLLSPNDYMTDIYLKSYRLDGIYKNKIISEGLPRNDFYYSTNRDVMIEELKNSGLAVDPNKKIIIYAPTFRGRFGKPTDRSEEYIEFLNTISSQIDMDEYQVFIKPHYAEFKVMTKIDEIIEHLIPIHIDANKLLKITDIMISDYSSIFFDYLISERPVLFYIPDLEKYKNSRGIIFEIEDLPGPVTKDINQLPKWINNIEEVEKEYKQRIIELRKQYCPYDDGNVSKRVLDIVLDHKEGYNVRGNYDSKKTKLLFYIGTLKTNGVTVSLMSLLNLIDYDKYDVSVYFNQNRDKNSIFKLDDFNSAVRMIARVSTYNATTKDEFAHGLITQFGLTKKICEKAYPQKMYENEFRRCFGDTEFDYIIDFAGYGSFMPRVILGDHHAKKLIWQHNNLPVDRKRVVNGVKPFDTELKVVFSLYKKFDKVVGCSRNISEVNRASLATEETFDKFTFAKNTIHAERILNGINSTRILEYQNKNYIILDEQNDQGVVCVNNMIEVPSSECVNFVTTGRMSVEKNQMNLLKAFHKLYETNKNCRLYLIGDGPLREKMIKYTNENGLEDGVIFTGNITNPFQLVKLCDCFVLPSKWEGQALVALETRVIGIPLIISSHPGYEAVCLENGQYVTDITVDSIYEGLQAFIEGRVPSIDADYNGYNQEAVREFEALLD